MGFGTEVLFFVTLGALIVGPKRLLTVIGHIGRVKARLEEVTKAFKSQLIEELDGEQTNRPEPSL